MKVLMLSFPETSISSQSFVATQFWLNLSSFFPMFCFGDKFRTYAPKTHIKLIFGRTVVCACTAPWKVSLAHELFLP